jgi:hypothetical protein
MDARKNSSTKDEKNQDNDQPRVLHESYCPKEPIEIPKNYYRPYKQPSGVLRDDARRNLCFYVTVNTPNATKELFDKIADNNRSECKIL